MSYGTTRLEDLRRRSSVTQLDMNTSFTSMDAPAARTFRTSSFALPPERAFLDLLIREQSLLQPMNVSHLPRRHSAHYCPPEHRPSMVSAQPPPIPLRPPAVPERSKIGPPPPISNSPYTSGLAYQKNLPPSLIQQQHHSLHHKTLQPHQHIPNQSIKHVANQSPIQNRQKPLKPKILPTISPLIQQPLHQIQPLDMPQMIESHNKHHSQLLMSQAIEKQHLHMQTHMIPQQRHQQPEVVKRHSQLNSKQPSIPHQQSLAHQLQQSHKPTAQQIHKSLPQTPKQNYMTQQPKTEQPLSFSSASNNKMSTQTRKPTTQQTQKQQQNFTTTQSKTDQPMSFTSASSNKMSARQDSNVSSDSFSQTSSPSYTTKTMETPLLPNNGSFNNQYQKVSSGSAGNKILNGTHDEAGNVAAIMGNNVGSNAALTKSISTPASLQTIVRFHHGSNMSLHHRIIRDMRRPSAHYVTRGRLRFRFAQVLVNAVALLAIAGGLAAYFRAYPSAVRYVNKTVTTSSKALAPHEDPNPAPGICLPVIVSFCQYHKVPYNFTMFPNYMGHFTQRDAQQV